MKGFEPSNTKKMDFDRQLINQEDRRAIDEMNIKEKRQHAIAMKDSYNQ
jgi:hypothetical protein